MSDASSSCSTQDEIPDFLISGVHITDTSWSFCGVINVTQEGFLVRVIKDHAEAVTVIITNGDYYGVSVQIGHNISDDPCIHEDNGATYTDADGDFDYIEAGLPEEVWQFVYGKIMAPIQIESSAA
jgi:hypothetical protein